MSKDINILIVDDNDENLIVVSAFLKDAGYKIALAFDGPSALKISEKVRVDLILLDVMMPDMDGYEVCRILKADPKRAEIPVVFLTAKTDTEDIVEGFKAGGVDYITKPFRKEELCARVRTHLEFSESKQTVREQSQVLAKANKQISDSLNYASGIQKELFQTHEEIQEVFPRSFLIFRPKHTLSGDFYWVLRHGNERIFVLADCTGHGIPGALISIMGIMLLNQIPEELLDKGPAKMLDYMRDHVKKTLNQQSMGSSITDGLDMGVLSINTQLNRVLFAGANIGLCRVSAKGKHETIAPDAMPVSVWLREKPFTLHSFPLLEHDRLYMYSDGFSDQFMLISKDRQTKIQAPILLAKSYHLDLDEQKKAIEQEISSWNSTTPQVDDISLIGVQL